MQDSPPVVTPENFAKAVGGYDKRAVEGFLDTLCAECGAPVVGSRPVPAGPEAGGPAIRGERLTALTKRAVEHALWWGR